MGGTDGYSVSEKELRVTVGQLPGEPSPCCTQELCPRDCTHMAHGLDLALLVLPRLELPHLPASTLLMSPDPSPLTSRGWSCSKFLPREISRHLGRSELARWLAPHPKGQFRAQEKADLPVQSCFLRGLPLFSNSKNPVGGCCIIHTHTEQRITLRMRINSEHFRIFVSSSQAGE